MNTARMNYKALSPVSCLSVFDGEVMSYIERCIAASKNSTKVFCHIPKTGGSSIRKALEAELPYFLNIGKYSELEQWDELIARQHAKPFDMISGHLRYAELRRLYGAGARIAAITFIREPVARVLSQYRFMISPKYPSHTAFKNRYPTFVNFVEEGVPENPMLNTLVGSCDSLQQALQSVAQNFLFVGLTEFSTMHSFLAQRCLGLASFEVPGRINRTVSTIDNKIEMSDEIYEMVTQKCDLDIQFYNFFEKKYHLISDEIFSAFNSTIFGAESSIPFPVTTRPSRS
jgi:hypothetical protein